MSISLRSIFCLAVFLVFLDLLAIQFGFFKGKVWIDMPLHFIGGILLGFIGIWMLQRTSAPRFFGMPSRSLKIIFVIFVALLGSYLWEIFEFLFSTFFPEIAGPWKFYSFTVSDMLSDIFFGILGGSVVALIYYRHK